LAKTNSFSSTTNHKEKLSQSGVKDRTILDHSSLRLDREWLPENTQVEEEEEEEEEDDDDDDDEIFI